MLVMTCIIFMMTYSGLLGTPGFSHKLSVFVDENNLSHEDIRDLIVRINQIESGYNGRFTQELKKIGKLKEKEKNNRRNSVFLLPVTNQEMKFYQENDSIDKNVENPDNIGVFFMRKDENNLRIRE